MKNSLVKMAPLFIISAAILWAVDGIVLRPSLYSLPVALVVFVEHLLGFAAILLLVGPEIKQIRKLKFADWGAFGWVALFGGALGTMFITKALFFVNFVNLSVVVLIQKLQPIFALLMAWLILKETLPKRFWMWASVGVVAAYFVTFSTLVPNFDTGDKTLMAALFALGAAFSWGSSTVFGKRGLEHISHKLGALLRFGLTAVIMFFLVAINGEFAQLSAITGTQWWTFILIVFTSGAAAMLIYYYGLKQVRASESTIYELAFPLSAIFLEMAVHQKFLTWTQWIGAAVLLFAMYKISTSEK